MPRTTATRSRTHAALDQALAAAGENVVLHVDGAHVAVTHLDRVYWPADDAGRQRALTKRDFLRYLVAVAPAMLPLVADRPMTLFRWPEGLARRRVLTKHWEIRLPAFVARVDVFSDAKGRTDEYILCNNLATLLWLGHMGTLELHVWHSRVTAGADSPIASTDFASSTASLQRSLLEFPDYILFDIDPFLYSGREAAGKEPELNERAFAKAKAVALSLKRLLDDMSLASWVKTSGKTGLHVVVPIRRTVNYATAREMARAVGAHLMHELPGEITMEWDVGRRKGKVFMDYKMNVRGKSMTAPYSPRGLPGAPVSMPLRWRDLGSAYPSDFRLDNAAALLGKRGDPWSDLLSAKQSLEERLAGASGR